MNDNEKTPNTTMEPHPAPYNAPGQDEDTTEGRKEERAHSKDGTVDAQDDGHGNAARNSAEGKRDQGDAHGIEGMPQEDDK